MGKKNAIPKVMKTAAAASLAAAILSGVLLCWFDRDIWLTLAVTSGTIAYHLIMRLMVGAVFDRVIKVGADYTGKWYRPRSWEAKLYRVLQVKNWKGKLPVYHPESFSPKQHTWDEIARAMCRAELVHEVNALLSFVPLAASLWFGAFAVFLLTSVGGAVFDLLFVMIQRYNRPRIVKLALRENPTAKS